MASIRLNSRLLCLGVAFAAGAMTCLGLSAAAVNISVWTTGAFILGAFSMILVEFLLPGAQRRACASVQGPSGLGAALAVALHNFPECFLVFSSATASSGLGLALGGAMLAHNIPLGISIALSLGQSPRRRQAWTYAVLAGVAPPLAAMLVYFCLRSLFTPEMVRILFAGAGGALVSFALAELVPFARRHGKPLPVVVGFAAGILLLLFILLCSYRG
jgi:ZIP family zinc transporter